jgi:hypothetical protein
VDRRDDQRDYLGHAVLLGSFQFGRT